MWYELEPLPGADTDDQRVFLDRARRTAAALGLADRPSWSTWWAMLTHRTDGMVLLADRANRWVCLPDDAPADTPRILAAGCHARARALDGPPPCLDAPLRWAHAIVPMSATLSRTARGGPGGGETDDDARLDPAHGAVVALNLRRQGVFETGRAKDWLADEFNSAPDMNRLQETGTAAVRVMAAAPSRAAALREAARAANALGLGFTPGVSAHASRPRMGAVWAAAALWVAAVGAYAAWGVWWPMIVASVLLAAAVARRARCAPDEALWQRPRHYWRIRARMRRADAADYKSRYGGDDHSSHVRHRMHAYAYQRSTFPLPSDTLAALTTPPPGANAVRAALSVRPDELADAHGPLLGLDAVGRPVRMPADVVWDGTVLIGKPGGGKSNSMHGLQRWASAHMRPDDSLIALEAKGRDSFPILSRLIAGMRFMDVADARTPIIDFLGDGDPAARAQRFASLMRGALGDEQIGPRSRAQIADAVELSLRALDAGDAFTRACAAAGVEPPAGWVECAYTLLFGHGAQAARAVASAAVNTLDDGAAREAAERLHGGVNPNTGRPAVSDGQLYAQLSAPMNKIGLLAAVPAVTAPGRVRITWRRILEHGIRLAVNLGDPVGADVAGVNEDARRLVGALLFQGLRVEVGDTCAGWEAHGRRVRIYVDELTDITGSDGRTGGNTAAVEWLRSRARAYGAELTVGTQYPEQLDARLTACILGFRTIGCYVMLSPSSAETMGAALDVDPAVLRSLPTHACVWRTTDGNGGSLPALTLSTPHFDAGADA
ncbi:hypothetical protein [Bifidobacterium castoris]|uniref:Uncharacterized protein n=1 Tax=Bifidobacterium castoris TaxID=2306972 RepID=A0A430FAI3_9BIFI|nr:hypothetical protein [Bifidobacterium castoris]RSX49847.1 hypothetical protein D2E22_0308 [Bifidobacterium castoris]